MLDIFCSLRLSFYFSPPDSVAKGLSNMASKPSRIQLLVANREPGRMFRWRENNGMTYIFLAPSFVGHLELVISLILKDEAFLKYILYTIVLD